VLLTRASRLAVRTPRTAAWCAAAHAAAPPPPSFAAAVHGVRRARAADAEPVASLWHESWQESHAAHVPPGLRAHRTLASFRRRIHPRLAQCLVADATSRRPMAAATATGASGRAGDAGDDDDAAAIDGFVVLAPPPSAREPAQEVRRRRASHGGCA
jgi:hypothetical protein